MIGAGGTFCPVARYLGAKVSGEIVVTAQEAEVEVDSECAIRGEIPELYFCSDMKGYGWCFRKGNVLNVGLGRLDPHGLSTHSAEFLKFLKAAGRLPRDFSAPLAGHAYLLQGNTSRTIVADGIALIGDAAGVAYAQSGEGIRSVSRSAEATIERRRMGRAHRPECSHPAHLCHRATAAGDAVVYARYRARPLVPAPG